jgi:hypothetical protein
LMFKEPRENGEGAETMGIDELLDSILAADARIMAVGIMDSKYGYLGHKIREGVALSFPKGEAFDNLLLSPTFMLGAAERFEPIFGSISRLSIRMERAILTLYRLRRYIIGVALRPETESAVLDLVGEGLKRLAD